MSLFDFFKPKKNETNEMFERMDASIFPKGDRDKNAATDELLRILNNKKRQVRSSLKQFLLVESHKILIKKD